MTYKATHSGHCQICGRFQKLPGNVLSKHGYTVEWGFFSGTCPGADYPPFEVSIDRIGRAINDAIDTREGLLNRARFWETNGDPDAVWVHEYKRPTGRGTGGYFWRKLDVATDVEVDDKKTYSNGSPRDYVKAHYTNGDGRRSEVEDYSFHKTLGALFNAANTKYAKYLRGEAANYAKYIDWQQKRIAGWVAHPEALVLVKDATERPADECSGSRTRSNNYQRKYVICGVCLKPVSNDYRTGKIRSHKIKEVAK